MFLIEKAALYCSVPHKKALGRENVLILFRERENVLKYAGVLFACLPRKLSPALYARGGSYGNQVARSE